MVVVGSEEREPCILLAKVVYIKPKLVQHIVRMKVIQMLSWIGVIAGCLLGGLVAATGLLSASGAPQEAVVLCLALALAIIPYCWARAWKEIANIDQPKPAEKSKDARYNHEKI